MSIQAVAWAIDQKTGSAAGKVVLICLANYADEDGKCWPSQKTIAEETELSERSVREWLQKLEDAGLLTREPRRRDDGYRAADLICLALKNQPAKSAGKPNLTGKSRQSHRQIAPISPEPVAAPTSFEPSREPSAEAAREETDLEKLDAKLFEAAGDKIQPHGALVLSSIYGLLEAGCDLETDILPTIRARASKLTRPAGSWAYFVPAIRDAYEQRIAAGKGLLKPKEPVTLGQWEQGLPPDEQRAKWAKTLAMARSTGQWKTWLWGPKPGDPGCRVPEDLIAAERFLRPERLTEETKVPA
ncbi:helix-turn-helix domain-containing protein [Aquamicrobium defluvii]|uniref:helix-turn-helix domain-containing protein n=1 Tax=Aquamicrobium defluvii TaxID=69279 RepID=UPI001414DF47|nr:helix-turn-helix domain-containing protein [Aquamicrobium defluvii]